MQQRQQRATDTPSNYAQMAALADELVSIIEDTQLRMLDLAASIYRARVEPKEEEVQPRRA